MKNRCGNNVPSLDEGHQDSVLLALTWNVVSKWVKYFGDLLNPTDMSFSKKANPGNFELGSPISFAVVTKVV